jgi:hypothetical protein
MLYLSHNICALTHSKIRSRLILFLQLQYFTALSGLPEVSIYKFKMGLTVKLQKVPLGAVGTALEITSRELILRVV